MIGLIQRVTTACVSVNGALIGATGPGLMILFGAEKGDTQALVRPLVQKICKLRIFPDQNKPMNLNLLADQAAGLAAPFDQPPLGVLIIPQFTLAADVTKGNRPGFHKAAPPAEGKALFEQFIHEMQDILGVDQVAGGAFGANMDVTLTNSGPATFTLFSRH